MTENNPIQLDGIEFVEYASPQPERLHNLFTAFGFSKTMRHEGMGPHCPASLSRHKMSPNDSETNA